MAKSSHQGWNQGWNQGLKMIALVGIALVASGCEGQFVLMGHTASMVVTCAMLWGTLKINRPGVGSEADETSKKK